jgi:uncharacterized membrane protein HdeD (DUF308 family)
MRTAVERIFVARGVVALVFAGLVFVVLWLAPEYAARVFAGFSILDGLLALYAGYHVRPVWNLPRRSALLAEGFIGCVAGVAVAILNGNAFLIAVAIGANAVIGGALASLYSFDEMRDQRAIWWSAYGALGLVLGVAEPGLSAIGIPAMMIALAAVVSVQGIARIVLRGTSGPRRRASALLGDRVKY